MQEMKVGRRYDVDWLRTLAFAVLILYHVGMYYVADWGWHIKSEHTSELLQEIMILTNPWRMSLLFFISAIALSLVQHRYSTGTLIGSRTMRLMVPLLFGMFIIVAPQVYFEALDQNLIEPGYWTFWLDYINPSTELLVEHHSPIGLLTWNHLWFLPYLWVYTVLILFMRKPLNAVAQSQYLQNAHSMIGITSIVCVFLLVWMLLRYRFPSTHALLDDWYNHGKYFSVFLFGYLFAQQKTWWQFVINHRRYWLAIALVCYLLAIADRQGAFDTLAELYQTSLALQLFYSTIVAINHWVWIFAAVGYAGFYLNKPSAVLTYATKAILPWYLLHQTVIIGLAWWFRSIHWPTWIEAIAIIILTASSCWLGYELIRRSRVLSWLSGLKPTYHPREQSTQKPNDDSPSNTSGITAHNT